MNSKEYLEIYKDKIYETAEFLCRKDPSKNVEAQYEELKKQYLKCDGTNHSETIDVGNGPLLISNWIEDIRHDSVENFRIIIMSSKGNALQYQVKGKQNSSYDIFLDDIDKAVLAFINKYDVLSIGLYIFHNHPFIYKATPSPTDIEALKTLLAEMDRIETLSQLMLKRKCKVNFIDFAIATEFDYWSAKQSM